MKLVLVHVCDRNEKKIKKKNIFALKQIIIMNIFMELYKMKALNTMYSIHIKLNKYEGFLLIYLYRDWNNCHCHQVQTSDTFD